MSQEITSALVKFHAHDLRNFLNGLEMDLTLLAESADGVERPAAVRRMRQETRRADAMIRCFAARFAVENKTAHSVADVAEQWTADARSLLPEAMIEWQIRSGDAALQIERARVRSALDDFIVLAARKCPRQPLKAGCAIEGSQAIFSVYGAPSSSLKKDDSLDSLLWSLIHDVATQNGASLERNSAAQQKQFAWHLAFPIVALKRAE